jgi:photosystem II stability/assembly factor-like uncharacterized protein
MLRKVTLVSLVVLFAAAQLFAVNGFERVDEIPIPEADKNDGGIGNMIAGVDVDEDGRKEIYLVNDNTYDGPTEVIPRIYKLEWNGSSWDSVWSAVAPVSYQNTWPGLALDDLDEDGKHELIWGPVNATSDNNPNPYRIVVYEEAGDGSDVMGVSDGEGGYSPNSSWTIVDEDGVNLRPTKFVIHDIDEDGTKELIFDDRKGQNSGYFFGVASVDDIPDNGLGGETWTLEVSGQDFELGTLYNKWDIGLIGNSCYFPCEWQIAKLSWDGSQWTYDSLPPLRGGVSFNSMQSVDVNGDGKNEIVATEYAWGSYGPYGEDTTRVVLLEEEGGELVHTPLFIMPTSVRMIGGDHGDIDQDGNMDFIFGTRYGIPNASIYRVEYNGGTSGEVDDPANWELTYADSSYMTFDNSGFGVDGIWNVISIANVDDDANQEVLYTSSTGVSAGLGQNMTPPVVVLDYTAETPVEFNELVLAEEVKLNGETPEGMLFKPGRILDDGNTIWFMGVDGDNKETWVFRSVDGGQTFTHNSTAIGGRGAQMDAYDQDVALVSTANGKIFKTTDGGETWSEAYSYSLGLGDGWFDGLRVLNDNVAVAFGDEANNGDMHFVRTEDKGESWTEIEGIDYLNSAYGYYTWGLGAWNIGEKIWCAGLTKDYDSGFLFHSADAGETWESHHIMEDSTNYPRSVVFINDNHGMITDNSGRIFKTADGGATWSQVELHANAGWANGVVAIPNTDMIISFDDNGVFYTSDMGSTWGEMTTPAATDDDYYVSGLFGSEEQAYFFTYNGQVLRFKDQVVGVEESDSPEMANKFELHQNYPNPFNPTTNITFDLAQSNHVVLTIYDITGREIAKLVDADLNSGRHTFNWNGKNKNGNPVSAGIYLYQVRTDNAIKTRRMTLIK